MNSVLYFNIGRISYGVFGGIYNAAVQLILIKKTFLQCGN